MSSASRSRRFVTLLFAASLTAGGCSAKYVRSPAQAATRPLPATSISRHVIVVSIDGLRPDAIATFNAPTLQRLMREGTYTLRASTIDPSKTLPSHTSMLTGELPELHGVLWNNVVTAHSGSIEIPNIFSVARSHGYSTAAFFSKPKFQPLQRPGTVDYSQAPGGLWGGWSAERTMNDVATYLAGAKPNLLFVHLKDPDAAGHKSGWMGDRYGRAVLKADTAVGRLVTLADATYGHGNYSLIVTADHGGQGRNHGSSDPQDVMIPWIAWGQGVRQGALASLTVRTIDTASTVLWILGVAEPSNWSGSPIVEAYQPLTPAHAGGIS